MVLRGTTTRIQNTVTDFDDTAYEPDSQEIKIYDSQGDLQETITTPTEEETGVYYTDYEIPDDGEIGRWLVRWKTVKLSKDSIDRFAIFVFSINEPTNAEIRRYLNNIPTDRVDDPQIEPQIYRAMRKVDTLSSADVSNELRYDAILAYAGYLTYMAYATEYERTAGELPGPILDQLERYKQEAEQFLGYIKRGTQIKGPPLLVLSDSYWTMYEAGELKGETI